MNRNLISFFLVPLTGLFLLFHQAAFQPALGQGDHGRDLYVFAQILNGQVPYLDFWWVYGPLMPYYYALFFKIFGMAIPSILIGKILLTVLAGTLIFFSLSRVIPALFAYMAALWFWTFQPDFYFTYNHIGGVTCLMAFTFCLFLYVIRPRTKYLSFALFFIFLLSLIKINFGLANLFALIIFYRLFDSFHRIPKTAGKQYLTQAAGIIVPLLLFAIYYLLLYKLSFFEIRQCLPYMSGDQPYHSTLWKTLYALGHAIVFNLLSTPANKIFAVFTISMIFLSLFKIFFGKAAPEERKTMIIVFFLLVFLYFINLHEYLLSGVLYRSYWATPFSTMLLFLIIGYGVKDISLSLQKILFAALFVIIFLRFVDGVNTIQNKKIPEQFLTHKRGRITSGNPENWFVTVERTMNFLQKEIPTQETFFALPYDPLYYYLADKKSPTRQLIFFEHINIPKEQERKIIKELEAHHTNWVVVSNRSWSAEKGLGVLGQTYCPLIGEYLEKNFTLVAEFGDWRKPAGWSANHATRILKRKTAL